MKTTFGFTLAALVAGLALWSCGLESNNHQASVPGRVNMGYATTFEKGDFIPDRRPLKSKDSRDLRELALTLPIWESDSDASTKWVYDNSSAATDADHWTTPADGAQSAVELKRLPKSSNGAQRLEIWVPPSKLNSSPSSNSWTSVLRRQEGGWLVESAKANHAGASATTAPRLASPVGLEDAIRTLPSQAVSSMSQKGRDTYLFSKSVDYNAKTRRLDLFGDSADAGDGDSMLFLRLFEDEDGRTIAASHSARPVGIGRDPSEADTFVFRMVGGRWVDITRAAIPSDVSRSWWFRFDKAGERVPCGPYEGNSSRDGRGDTYDFGKARGTLVWRNGAFQFQSEG